MSDSRAKEWIKDGRTMTESLQKRFRGPMGSSGPLAGLVSSLWRVVCSCCFPHRTGLGVGRPGLRLADCLSLGPRQSLALVEFSGQFLLVTVGGEGAPTVLPIPLIPSRENDPSDNGKGYRPVGRVSNCGTARSKAGSGHAPARLRRPRRLAC